MLKPGKKPLLLLLLLLAVGVDIIEEGRARCAEGGVEGGKCRACGRAGEGDVAR